jgi:broad specificity phosphatase PhoE
MVSMGLLTIVRHGQASFLQADYDKMSSLGERQARVLGEYWAKHGVAFDHVYAGPARRQIGTAVIVEQVYRKLGLAWPEAVSVPEFDEYAGLEVMRSFLPGLVEKHEDIRLLDREFRTAGEQTAAARAFEKMFQRVTRMWVAGELDSPDVEPWRAFCDRVERGVNKVRDAGGRAAVFSSGGVMAATVRLALDLSPVRTLELSWTPRNGAYSEFLFSAERFSMATFNAFPHLDSPGLLTWR